MAKRRWIFIFLLFLLAGLYAVSTEYISDYNFKRISDYSFSNVSFIDEGGIELSHKYSVYYESDDIIWSITRWKDGFLIGGGETAELSFIDGKTNTTIIEDSNYVLISDIELHKDRIYASAVPKAVIFEISDDFKLNRTIDFTNDYIWDMVADGKGIYVLAGEPANLYYLKNGKKKLILEFEEEEHLMVGRMIDGVLYFSSEKILYKLYKNRAVAVASFNNNIADFNSYNGQLYLITARLDRKLATKTRTKKNSSSSSYQKSSLYEIKKDGSVEKIYTQSGYKFLSLSAMRDSLIIGTDKDGGYIEVKLHKNKKSFTSLGEGQFVKMIQKTGPRRTEVFAVMIHPARVVKLEPNYAQKGYFISKVFDTKNFSTWGIPMIDKIVNPSTELNIYTRSGAVEDESLWEDWIMSNLKINCKPNHFIQYKAELLSSGKNTPIFVGVSIPYVQKNIAPKIISIKDNYNKDYVKISWNADDENSDKINYDIYIAPKNEKWVKLNTEAITDTDYKIYYNLFPAGIYRVKIEASDSIANANSVAKTDVKIYQNDVYIDGTAPVISGLKQSFKNGKTTINFKASDAMIPINHAYYNINGDEWVSINPDDAIFDSNEESFTVELKLETPTFVQVKVRDLIGNSSTAGLYVK